MGWVVVEVDGQRRRVAIQRDGHGTWLGWQGGAAQLQPKTTARKRPMASGDIAAPLTGKVVEVRARAGDNVAADDVLVVIEAMKMEYRLYAPRAACVEQVLCQPGERVDKGALLVRLSA